MTNTYDAEMQALLKVLTLNTPVAIDRPLNSTGSTYYDFDWASRHFCVEVQPTIVADGKARPASICIWVNAGTSAEEGYPFTSMHAFGSKLAQLLDHAKKGCNRHEYCIVADAIAKAQGKSTHNLHCSDDCCEDCFGQ